MEQRNGTEILIAEYKTIGELTEKLGIATQEAARAMVSLNRAMKGLRAEYEKHLHQEPK